MVFPPEMTIFMEIDPWKFGESQLTNFQFKFQFEVISSHENQAQMMRWNGWNSITYMITTVSSQKREEAWYMTGSVFGVMVQLLGQWWLFGFLFSLANFRIKAALILVFFEIRSCWDHLPLFWVQLQYCQFFGQTPW